MISPTTVQPQGGAAVPALQITGLIKAFGGLRAVSNFDLTVQPGALDGLIGPNGAGKTLSST
jgi:ABC-type branched-subunit amino acid transport system ATPase component